MARCWYIRSTVEASARRRVNAEHGTHVDEETTGWLINITEEADCLLRDIDRAPEVDLVEN
jgi:hypothetical protein